MSLFRKPKKIQRRVFCADDDDEEPDTEPQAPPPPVISRDKKENKPLKSKQLLSFADEEEEGEVFKVKKSKQSNRLAKKREKEKKKPQDNNSNNDGNQNDNNIPEEKPEKQEEKPKKKITLEGLILSGREALAADGAGDVSDDESPDLEERGFHQYRAESVRAALAAGTHIPDPALIHAARKTRQQARELGGDYIPIKESSTAAGGSRLVREDGSGDEDEDGRIQVRGLDMPTDKPKRGTAVAPATEELDSEPDEWEEQQIKKAMPALPDMAGGDVSELNPFAVALPAAQLEADHTAPLVQPGKPLPTSAQELADALRDRLDVLETERTEMNKKKQELEDRLMVATRTQESRSAKRITLDRAYRRAQAVRGYLTDLIECLDEKMPELEALESRALSLHRRRCEYLTERRRTDLSDQAQDMLAMAARPGLAPRPPDSEDKVRRAAEREGRRRARRLAREAAAAAAGTAVRHRDGDSSDDDLPPAEAQYLAFEREQIRSASAALFSDALPAWRSCGGVAARLARWRRRDPAAYCDAYMPECLPKLIAPYVRHELVLWNPLADEDNEDYERMDWYKCLMMYGVTNEPISDSDLSDTDDEADTEVRVSEGSVREDPDLMLVPTIVSKVLLPKLTELVEASWDPMCVRACIRLRHLCLRLAATPRCGPALKPLATAIAAKLTAATNADVFLPALPPQLMDSAGGSFWRRCVGAAVRLLRSALALTPPPDMLNAGYIVMTLLETLCRAAAAGPAPLVSAAASALADTVPRSHSHLRAPALTRIAALAQNALNRLHTDNPLHLKAIEQARAVIAEAKALE